VMILRPSIRVNLCPFVVCLCRWDVCCVKAKRGRIAYFFHEWAMQTEPGCKQPKKRSDPNAVMALLDPV
jgi:hypothetical protein